MTDRLRTALVALLVVVGFALPVSAAPIDVQLEAGFTHFVSRLVDTILDSVATVLPAGDGAVAKGDTDSDGTTGLRVHGGFEPMRLGLEPNG